jgi:phosphoribosylaminoimidazole-succinocarboxamide synthase
MQEGLKENDPFSAPIITPSTKAAEGHDEDIDANTIVASGLATQNEWNKLSALALKLFERGTQIASNRGLILVDTKYEFGKIGDDIYLMDEVHTPDSSRYFFTEGYKERQAKGERQPQLSKEFVREWLIENNFMGKEGQAVPIMSDEWVATISKRYVELYEKVIGEPFTPVQLSEDEIKNRTEQALQKTG